MRQLIPPSSQRVESSELWEPGVLFILFSLDPGNGMALLVFKVSFPSLLNLSSNTFIDTLRICDHSRSSQVDNEISYHNRKNLTSWKYSCSSHLFLSYNYDESSPNYKNHSTNTNHSIYVKSQYNYRIVVSNVCLPSFVSCPFQAQQATQRKRRLFTDLSATIQNPTGRADYQRKARGRSKTKDQPCGK